MRHRLMNQSSDLMRLVAQQDKGYTPLNLSAHNLVLEDRSTTDRIAEWNRKTIHGRYPKLTTAPGTDKKSSFKWLTRKELYPETEGFIIAIQDRVIRTRNYEKHCLKLDVTDKCRKCGLVGETIEHITAGCTALAESSYLGKHNQVAKLVHQQLEIKYERFDVMPPPYYKYNPLPVIENHNVVLYWDRPMQTDRTVDYNRPDNMLIHKDKKNRNYHRHCCTSQSQHQEDRDRKVYQI